MKLPATILLVGATSGIAEAVAREMARHSCPLVLAARNEQELQALAADLRIRYAIPVHCLSFDALLYASHRAMLHEADTCFAQPLDGVIVCHGLMYPQDDAEHCFEKAREMLEVNLLSPVSILQHAAALLEGRHNGFLAAVSSVAGDRGRQSNYIYGASKAGLTAYLSGLRNHLHHSGVRVLTIKPGFVRTKMTHHFLNSGSLLVASPHRVARDVVRAIQKQSDVLYTPFYWRYVMQLIRMLPEWLFKRLRL